MLTTFLLVALSTAVAQAGDPGIAIRSDTPSPGRSTFTTPFYSIVINAETPQIDAFTANGFQLIDLPGLAATINTGAPWGPARQTVERTDPHLVHIKLDQMRWESTLDGEIELHFYCYRNRVVVRFDIVPRSTPPSLALGWIGNAVQATPMPRLDADTDWRNLIGIDELGPAVLLLPPLNKGVPGRRGAHVRIDRGGAVYSQYVYGNHEIGVRSSACTLVAAADESDLIQELDREQQRRAMTFDVQGGRHAGYDAGTGWHEFIHKPGAETLTIAPAAAGHDVFGAVRSQGSNTVTLRGDDFNPARVSGYWVFPIPSGPSAGPSRLTFSHSSE